MYYGNIVKVLTCLRWLRGDTRS